jgi:N-acetylglucosamine-6-phosphate deacetylase
MNITPQQKINGEGKSFAGKIWKDGNFVPTEFYIQDGRIREGGKKDQIKAAYITPPFSDPHIHGGWGISFQDGEFEQLENKLKSKGIFFAIPTLDNNDIEELRHTATLFRDYKARTPNSIFPFLRVEGPFISLEKRGFQRKDCILKASLNNIDALLNIKEIKLFTFAPEIAGAETLVRKAIHLGKIPSIGHSKASFQNFLKFYKLGIRHLTHYPNAMSGFHHRDIGLTGAGLFIDDLQLEIIADGIHSSFDFISLVLKTKGPVFSIISDMIPPSYSEQDRFDGRRIIKNGKKMTTKDGTIAGGSTSVPEQAEWLYHKGVKPENIVRLACLNTLHVFGIPSPSISNGNEATFLVLDDSMKVKDIYYKGKKIPGSSR